ncbi:MAG: DUF1080 domain-containing protein [Verrucomicrobiota bacterium]
MKIEMATMMTASLLFLFHLPAQATPPLHGSWAFELPDGNPAWLQIKNGSEGRLLWSVGSARPVKNLQIKDAKISFERPLKWKPFGKADDVRLITEPFEGLIKANGDIVLKASQSRQGQADSIEQLTLPGKKMPAFPSRPDLSKLRFGDAIPLFNGKDLSGWELSNPKKKNGWRAEEGILINETPKTDFGAYGEYGNLITKGKFEDFRLTIEYQVPAKGNSGIYLRGMYEAQVVDRDSRMQGIIGPGSIFGRITPSGNAGKAGGKWNLYVLTLIDRHITVKLNGKTVINNQPIEGCTGGGLSADDTAPGPILLQGDHTNVRYRNIVLEPVVK